MQTGFRPKGQDGQEGPPTVQLRIGTQTYFADGKNGFTGTSPSIQISQPITMYVHSGKTACEDVRTSTTLPATAEFGWRVDIVPTQQTATSLIVTVTWRRLWERGVRVPESVRGPVQLVLHAGDRVVLDYLSAAGVTTPGPGFKNFQVDGRGKAFFFFNEKLDKTFQLSAKRRLTEQSSGPPCNAVGMGLEIGGDSGRTPALMEADLWLVHTLVNGTEQSQHQTIRLQPGAPTPYYFDPVMIAFPKAFFFFNENVSISPGATNFTVSGSLSGAPDPANPGQLLLTIAGQTSIPTRAGKAFSSQARVNGAQSEVLAIELLPSSEGRGAVRPDTATAPVEKLSIRISARQIR